MKDKLFLIYSRVNKIIIAWVIIFTFVEIARSAYPSVTAFYIDDNAVWVGDNRYIKYTNVTLHLYANNANYMRFKNSGGSWSDWEPYSTSRSGWILPSVDGQKTVYVQVSTCVPPGSIDESYTQIILDQTAPSTSHSLSGTLGDNGWYKSNITVTLSASDSGSGVDKTYYAIDYGSYQQYSSPFSIGNDGQYTVYYYSTDKAGNLESTKSVTVKIDKTAPSLSMNAEPTYTAGTSNGVSGTASDSTSGDMFR